MCKEKKKRVNTMSETYCFEELETIANGMNPQEVANLKARQMVDYLSDSNDDFDARQFTITIKFRRTTITITITF